MAITNTFAAGVKKHASTIAFTLKQYATMQNLTMFTFLLLAASMSFAGSGGGGGSDTTFESIQTMLQDWVEGSLGKVVALGAFGVGLVTAIVKQSLMFAVVGVGLAVAAYYGPTILLGLFSATL